MSRFVCLVCSCPLILFPGDYGTRFRCARCIEEHRYAALDTAEGRRAWARIARATNSIPRILRAA